VLTPEKIYFKMKENNSVHLISSQILIFSDERSKVKSTYVSSFYKEQTKNV